MKVTNWNFGELLVFAHSLFMFKTLHSTVFFLHFFSQLFSQMVYDNVHFPIVEKSPLFAKCVYDVRICLFVWCLWLFNVHLFRRMCSACVLLSVYVPFPSQCNAQDVLTKYRFVVGMDKKWKTNSPPKIHFEAISFPFPRFSNKTEENSHSYKNSKSISIGSGSGDGDGSNPPCLFYFLYKLTHTPIAKLLYWNASLTHALVNSM